jgi:tetratricopeptide (TPR) repeat protein
LVAALAFLLIRQGQNDLAEALLEESVAIFRQLGDGFGEAFALAWLANAIFMRADFPAVLVHVAASEAVCEGISAGLAPDELVILRFLQRITRGYVAFYMGDRDLSRALLEPLLAEQRRLGVPASSYVLYFLGMVAMAEKRMDAAQAYLREALVSGRESGDLANLAVIVEAVAGLAAVLGESERAARLGGAAEALRRLIGAPLPGVEQRKTRDRQLAPAREALGEEAFARAWADGQAMTLEQAVEYALQDALEEEGGA